MRQKTKRRRRKLQAAMKAIRKTAANKPARVDLQIVTGKLVSLSAAAGNAVREFELLAYTGGPLNLPNYDVPVIFDLASMTTPENTTQTPLLLEHSFDQPVGHSDDLQISTDGVRGSGKMSVASSFRDMVVASADNGYEWQLSVGGSALDEDITFFAAGETFRANNRSFGGPAIFVKNYLLREVSFVAAGADQTGAVARLVAAYNARDIKGSQKMRFEAWLKSKGHVLADLSADALARLRREYDAEQAVDDTEPDPEDVGGDDEVDDTLEDETADETEDAEDSGDETDPVADYREQIAAETERNEELVALNARFGSPRATIGGREVSLLAHAQRNGWNADRFELELRRRQRPQSGPHRRSETNGQGREVILASMSYAILNHANARIDRQFTSESSRIYLNANFLADPNSEARQRAMNASRDYRHHSLIDLIASAMELDGVECTSPRRSEQWFRAAFSSNSVQTLFTQSTQAILLDTFEQMGNRLGLIVRDRDVPNFKTNERKVVSPDTGEMERLNPTGTAGDAKLSATGEEYKISRFAKRWGIDDQDMINEDFGVFEDMPQFLGMSAARLYDQVIAKLLLSNPNMADGSAWFNTTDGNLRTSSALSLTNLKAALIQFGLQSDGGVNLDLDPNLALVPKTLRFTLAELLAPAPRITGSDVTTTSKNVLEDEIATQLHSSLLDNGFNDPDDRTTAIAGNTTSWYLFDTRYPSVEVGHLQGTGRGPQIRTGTYSDGRYGVWFDVKRDLGAAPMRRESAQRNNA